MESCDAAVVFRGLLRAKSEFDALAGEKSTFVPFHQFLTKRGVCQGNIRNIRMRNAEFKNETKKMIPHMGRSRSAPVLGNKKEFKREEALWYSGENTQAKDPGA
jgi:hypothetical protein